MERATIKVNPDILDQTPSSAIPVKFVGSNSNTKKVFKPITETRRTEKIASVVVDEQEETAEFLVDDGTESFDIELLQPWNGSENVVHIFGASDDLVEIRGVMSEEFNVYPTGAFRLKDVIFTAEYDKNGEWVFEVDQNDDSDVLIDPVGSHLSDVLSSHSEVLTIKMDEEPDEIKKLG